MNYKNIFIILLIITIIATLFITVKKPKMHKVALIYNSDYKIVKDETPQKEERNIPTVTQEEQTISVQKRLQNNVEKEEKYALPQTTTVKKEITKPQKNTVVTTAKKEVPIQQKQTKTTTQSPAKTQQVKTVSQPKKVKQVKVAETPKKVEQTKIVEVPKKVETPKVSNIIVQPKITQTTTVQQKPKVLTKEQEEIAWNVWRSNIQNQIMKDTHLPSVPNGTVFRFTFDVDKYGKVSNIQTYSDTKMYTPYAIQYIAPVIRGYQGKSILNFPAGTARTITTVKGAWKISSNTRYSTPKDYNDTEVINR